MASIFDILHSILNGPSSDLDSLGIPRENAGLPPAAPSRSIDWNSAIDTYNKGFDTVAPIAFPVLGTIVGGAAGHPFLGGAAGSALATIGTEFGPSTESPIKSIPESLAEVAVPTGNTISSKDIQDLVQSRKPIVVRGGDTVDLSGSKGSFSKYDGEKVLKNLWGDQDPSTVAIANELSTKADTLRRRGRDSASEKLLELAAGIKSQGSETSMKRKELQAYKYEEALTSAQKAKNSIINELNKTDPSLLPYLGRDLSGEKIPEAKKRKIEVYNKLIDDTFKNSMGRHYAQYKQEGGDVPSIPSVVTTSPGEKTDAQMDEEDSSFNKYLLTGIGLAATAMLAKKFGVTKAIAAKLMKSSPDIAKAAIQAATK